MKITDIEKGRSEFSPLVSIFFLKVFLLGSALIYYSESLRFCFTFALLFSRWDQSLFLLSLFLLIGHSISIL